MSDESPLTLIEEISTRWSVVANPMTFVLRYGPAVRAYMSALLPDRHDADDATQDFLLRTLHQPTFDPNRVTRGRFRDYLKATLRHAAIDHIRKRQRRDRVSNATEIDDCEAKADSAWDGQWRQVLLDRCWEGLETQQRAGKGNYGYRVLQLTTQCPDDDSVVLAEKLSVEIGSTITSEAFRKQRSRARKEFARLLIAEVKQTLESPSGDQIVEELAALELLDFVRDYLPENYRERSFPQT